MLYNVHYFPEHKQYIDTFCKNFKTTLEDMIISGIAERLQTDLTDELHNECVQHATFAQEKCKLFHGRKQFIEVLKKEITATEDKR